MIPVTNDTVPEVPEHFSIVLSMATPLAGVILTPDNATVVINDDDGKSFFFFFFFFFFFNKWKNSSLFN